MNELEDFLSKTIPRQIKAEEAIHNGDVSLRLEMWSTKDPVTIFGAFGPCNSGTDEVTRTFKWVASIFSNCTYYNFELIAAGVSEELAYTVGYEDSVRAVSGGPQESSKLRVTHIYRKEKGEWKIVHRHADFLPVDQSPKEIVGN
jgi:ketosteroid isomerase-like protein